MSPQTPEIPDIPQVAKKVEGLLGDISDAVLRELLHNIGGPLAPTRFKPCRSGENSPTAFLHTYGPDQGSTSACGRTTEPPVPSSSTGTYSYLCSECVTVMKTAGLPSSFFTSVPQKAPTV
ncbi:MAG TPA: hypothetical protein VGC45_11340 [Gryllotalpicola sp.]